MMKKCYKAYIGLYRVIGRVLAPGAAGTPWHGPPGPAVWLGCGVPCCSLFNGVIMVIGWLYGLYGLPGGYIGAIFVMLVT